MCILMHNSKIEFVKCMYMCMQALAHMHVYIYVCIFMCVYIHAHTYKLTGFDSGVIFLQFSVRSNLL